MKRFWLVFLLCISLSIASCNTKYPEPGGASTVKGMALSTPSPVKPLAAKKETVAPPPTELPLNAWNGMPIMPGGRDGRRVGQSYTFVVDAMVMDVDEYYRLSLVGLGWEMILHNYTSVGAFGGPALVMKFVRNGEEAGVLAAYSKAYQYTIVTLTHNLRAGAAQEMAAPAH